MKKILMLLSIIFLCISQKCGAHLPRLVNENSCENPVIVNDPEISQAFYGRLDGAPHFFKIVSPEPFVLYANILVPEAMGARIDFVAEILHDDVSLSKLSDGSWSHFYEHFAGDSYIKGPEFERRVDPGAYVIKISNEDNLGYYILALGKKEWFVPSEIINVYRLLPYIKEEFFQKSPITAYCNLFTLLLVLMMLGLLFILRSMICWLLRYKKFHFFVIAMGLSCFFGLRCSQEPSEETEKALFEKNGASALHKAASLGDEDVVKELIQQRADVNGRDNFGYTPLYYTAIMGQASMAAFLVRTCGANIYTCDHNGFLIDDLVNRLITKNRERVLKTEDDRNYYNALLRIKYFLKWEHERARIQQLIAMSVLKKPSDKVATNDEKKVELAAIRKPEEVLIASVKNPGEHKNTVKKQDVMKGSQKNTIMGFVMPEPVFVRSTQPARNNKKKTKQQSMKVVGKKISCYQRS
jgi:hypothetical protein